MSMHICIRKLNFLTAVNFSLAYCNNSSSQHLVSEGWRVELWVRVELEWHWFVFCFLFFCFYVGFFSFFFFFSWFVLRNYPLLEAIACKFYSLPIFCTVYHFHSSGWLIRWILLMFCCMTSSSILVSSFSLERMSFSCHHLCFQAPPFHLSLSMGNKNIGLVSCESQSLTPRDG